MSAFAGATSVVTGAAAGIGRGRAADYGLARCSTRSRVTQNTH